MSKIKISDYITLNQDVTPDEGAKIYDMIVACISRGETPVELDFSDNDIMTTAFLNVAVGSLYKDFTSEELNQYLQLQGLSESHMIRVKQVTNNAKAFYADKEEFDKNVEDALYGKS